MQIGRGMFFLGLSISDAASEIPAKPVNAKNIISTAEAKLPSLSSSIAGIICAGSTKNTPSRIRKAIGISLPMVALVSVRASLIVDIDRPHFLNARISATHRLRVDFGGQHQLALTGGDFLIQPLG